MSLESLSKNVNNGDINSGKITLLYMKPEGKTQHPSLTLRFEGNGSLKRDDLRKRRDNANSSDNRVVRKDGERNFRPANVEQLKMKLVSDIFTTIVDVSWFWTICTFTSLYFGSWLAFALMWYSIVYIHGDTIGPTDGTTPCITGIHTFTAAYLFSVETQHTTGYGFYQITEECSSAIILFCIQSIFGVILEGAMVGLVFVKISKAKKRRETLLFSRNAVISYRDGVLCFLFRVADMRKQSHLLEAHIRAQVVRKRVTEEGESIMFSQEELQVSGEGEKDDRLLLFWPTTVVHKIVPGSPLYNLKPEDLHESNSSFEIVVVLEGIVESTGLNTQARSSYLPAEILWGHRFSNLTLTDKKYGTKIVDYSEFHKTIPLQTKF